MGGPLGISGDFSVNQKTGVSPRAGTRKGVIGTQHFNGGKISSIATYFLLDKNRAVKTNGKFFTVLVKKDTWLSEAARQMCHGTAPKNQGYGAYRPGMIYRLLYYAHPHVTRLDDAGRTFLLQHNAYEDFSKLSEAKRRDRLNHIQPGEIYLLRYRTTGPRSRPKIPKCVAGLDTDEARKDFLDFLSKAAMDKGLLLDLANEFLSGFIGYTAAGALAVINLIYGLYGIFKDIYKSLFEDWQVEYVTLCSMAFVTASIQYNIPLSTRTTVPTSIWLYANFLSWDSRMAKNTKTFCKQLQTAWEKSFDETEQKAEEQLVKDYRDTVMRVLKMLTELTQRGNLSEDDDAVAQYLRCAVNSMSLDDFRELRRMLTEKEVGPPATYLAQFLETVGDELAEHNVAKAGLKQLALKYQRRAFGDGISPTVSFRRLGEDLY
nr:hypothetical protein [uncultured Desulfobacter sp.]